MLQAVKSSPETTTVGAHSLILQYSRPSPRSFSFSTATRVIDGLLLRITKPLVVRDLLVPEPRIYSIRHTSSWLGICFCRLWSRGAEETLTNTAS
jgi:hypothetical protein